MPTIYGTLAGANTYHSDRGNTTWTGADGLKSAALLRASVWVDATYRPLFPGLKTGQRAQEREWPRVGAMDRECNGIASDEVPVEIISATYEAALRELVTPASLSPDFVNASQVKRQKVGPIEREFFDGSRSIDDVRPIVSVVEDILAPLIGRRGPVLFGSSARV